MRKSEIRSTKSERNPKPKIPKTKPPGQRAWVIRICLWDFFRISCFGFRIFFHRRTGGEHARAYLSARSTALTTRSTSASVVCQLQTEIRVQRSPRHVVPPKNASPPSRTFAINLLCALRMVLLPSLPGSAPGADQNLVEAWLPHQFRALERADTRCELSGEPAGALRPGRRRHSAPAVRRAA